MTASFFSTLLGTQKQTLANGSHIPKLGLGVWQVAEGTKIEDTTLKALEMGYRLIDTAAIYGNETGVGRAIARSGLPRNEIFVTSKLWNEDIRQKNESHALDATLDKLGLDYLDLYLIHWPIKGRIAEPWIELTKFAESKRVKAIGVSNFHEHHLTELFSKSGIKPALNQVELTPLLQQKTLRKFCLQHEIAVQAWSPLMQGNFKGIKVLETIAAKHGRTVPQVILQWNVSEGILTIPKTVTPERMAENAKALEFKLDAQDIAEIQGLDNGKRFGPDPDNFNF